MNVSEAIHILESLRSEHGDVDVINDNEEEVDIEFNDHPSPAVVIS